MSKLEKIFCEVFNIEKKMINETLSIEKLESWDSLTHMDLVTSIEKELNIEFTMDEIVKMQDIKTIKSIISKKIN